MPADHAHLAAQKLDTVREDHVLPVRAQAERHGAMRAGTPRTPARGSSPRRTGFSLHPGCIRRGQVKYQVAGEGPPSKLLSPGLSALSSPARLLLCSVLQEARAEANRSQGASPQTSLSLPRLSAPEAVDVPASTGGPGPWAHSPLHCGVGVASCCG